MKPFSHYQCRQKFSMYGIFQALPSDIIDETQPQSAEDNTPSKLEAEKTMSATIPKTTRTFSDIASFPDDSKWINKVQSHWFCNFAINQLEILIPNCVKWNCNSETMISMCKSALRRINTILCCTWQLLFDAHFLLFPSTRSHCCKSHFSFQNVKNDE